MTFEQVVGSEMVVCLSCGLEQRHLFRLLDSSRVSELIVGSGMVICLSCGLQERPLFRLSVRRESVRVVG